MSWSGILALFGTIVLQNLSVHYHILTFRKDKRWKNKEEEIESWVPINRKLRILNEKNFGQVDFLPTYER